MSRNKYSKPLPARLVLTHNEAGVLLGCLEFLLEEFTGPKSERATVVSIKTKLGVEIARVGGGKLRGSGR